jgi:hypothetical protein
MSEYNSSFYCALTMELMTDPVMDADGFTYERRIIEQWIASNGTSPMTRAPLSTADLRPNRALKSAIEEEKTRHSKKEPIKQCAPAQAVSKSVTNVSTAAPAPFISGSPFGTDTYLDKTSPFRFESSSPFNLGCLPTTSANLSANFMRRSSSATSFRSAVKGSRNRRAIPPPSANSSKSTESPAPQLDGSRKMASPSAPFGMGASRPMPGRIFGSAPPFLGSGKASPAAAFPPSSQGRSFGSNVGGALSTFGTVALFGSNSASASPAAPFAPPAGKFSMGSVSCKPNEMRKQSWFKSPLSQRQMPPKWRGTS